MNDFPEGNAIIYCEGAFGTPYGKTAHGLVRRTERYRVLSVVDSRHAGADTGQLLNDRSTGIPILADLVQAIEAAAETANPATHLVIGLATDGGRLPVDAREAVRTALKRRLNVDSGLHDLLTDDPELLSLAAQGGVQIRDIRKPPPRTELHFFTGKIEEVDCLKVAVLGTDSAVGKRTTALRLVDGLRERGLEAEMIGTGQTAWLQGVRYGVILDALINDFVAGEIEHAVWSAWNDLRPDVLVLEGQGSLMNPAYPGGFEILAAARPDAIVLQHAPARKEYDGLPGYRLHPLNRQIRAIELISGKPVVAITLNHENLTREELIHAMRKIRRATGRPVLDVLRDGTASLAGVISKCLADRSVIA
jgi:uncharacterized NAD-dependent epimerase/dehydratase family protein